MLLIAPSVDAVDRAAVALLIAPRVDRLALLLTCHPALLNDSLLLFVAAAATLTHLLKTVTSKTRVHAT
jgi:hypothetical protein